MHWRCDLSCYMDKHNLSLVFKVVRVKQQQRGDPTSPQTPADAHHLLKPDDQRPACQTSTAQSQSPLDSNISPDPLAEGLGRHCPSTPYLTKGAMAALHQAARSAGRPALRGVWPGAPAPPQDVLRRPTRPFRVPDDFLLSC